MTQNKHYFIRRYKPRMPERREGHDPIREARELGARITERINNEKEATRKDAFRDREN